MFNNYFENQSIWNTLSTEKLILSSYHEKGSGSWLGQNIIKISFIFH